MSETQNTLRLRDCAAAASAPAGGVTPLNHPVKKSYGQILKSSALIGGSTVLNSIFGILRNKGLALLLGPGGYGFLNLYQRVVDLVRTIAGLGINTSGVRQIAEAVGSGDSSRVASTVVTLRRVALYSGALGAVLLLLLSKPVSWLTFGDYKHAAPVALLAIAAFLGDVSAGQGALIQGMRRIADLARMNVLAALYGTAFSLAIVYFWRNDLGMVLSLVCVAAMSILTSWWYASKIKIETVKITVRQVLAEASGLLRLGFVFMASALMSLGAAYLVCVILRRKIGGEAVGYYQAAWTWGGQYVGFIIQAMGADFYPRLTGVAKDNTECNRLVNEQSEVGLLMAGPGILATLTFAPLVMTVFYSPAFWPAAEILRWICLGMILRVVTWPMGFIILAKGEGRIFFWTEVLTSAGYAALVWTGVQTRGLQGAGIAFFILYAVSFLIVYIIVRRLSGFRWSRANRQLALMFVPAVAVVFAGWYLLPRAAAVLLGVTLTMLTGIYSLIALCKLVPAERLPRSARKLAGLLGLPFTFAESNTQPSGTKMEMETIDKDTKQ